MPDNLPVLVLDKPGGHTAKYLYIPEHVRFVWLPPYSPALNSIERIWRNLKDQFTWQPFADVAAQQDYVADVRCAYDARTLQSLTAYPYVAAAVNALSS